MAKAVAHVDFGQTSLTTSPLAHAASKAPVIARLSLGEVEGYGFQGEGLVDFGLIPLAICHVTTTPVDKHSRCFGFRAGRQGSATRVSMGFPLTLTTPT